MDAAARNNAIDKLASRALWWFRWAAVATVVSGLLILGFQRQLDDMDYFKSPPGMAIAVGILLALTMFVNVWGIIWRNQKTVIANARNVQAGGEADPNAPAAGRAGAMASRQNTIFSLPLLVFMVGASHFYAYSHFDPKPSIGIWLLYLLIGIAVAAILEANALGKVSGRGSGGLNVIYETHKNAMYTGFALILGFYILAEIMLRS